MIPVTFPQANTEYEKPVTMPDEHCMPISAFKGTDENGYPVIITKWQLNYEDIEYIKNTGELWLVIVGTNFPPLTITTETPFE